MCRGFEIVFRYRSAGYDIAVENPRAVCAEFDGSALPGNRALFPGGRRRDPSGVLDSRALVARLP